MDRELGLLGWSQAELARRLAVKPTTVTRWKERGLPRAVSAYLGAMVEVKEAHDKLGALLAKQSPKSRRARGAGNEAWEPSATDHAPQMVDGDYRKRLERHEDADMNQDSGEWGKG